MNGGANQPTLSFGSDLGYQGFNENSIGILSDPLGNDSDVEPELKSPYSGTANPDLFLTLEPRPKPGETVALASRWAFCIEGPVPTADPPRMGLDVEMRRITAAVRVLGSNQSTLRVIGCDSTPDASGIRTCTTPGLETFVDPSTSFTMGPYLDSASSGGQPLVTLYAILEGIPRPTSEPSFGPPGVKQCLAMIDYDNPFPGNAPVIEVETVQGYDEISAFYLPPRSASAHASSSPLSAPSHSAHSFRRNFNVLSTVPTTSTTTFVFGEEDNCRFENNPRVAPDGAQPNRGDVLAFGPPFDDDGDACECGDTNQSGAVFDGPSDTTSPPT